MARPGPAGKNKTTQLVVIQGAKPDPVEGWSAGTLEGWDEFWESPASQVVSTKDYAALRRMFILRDDVDRFRRLARADGEVVLGSTGQPSMHPALKYVLSLQVELRALEDRFGLTPKRGVELGLKVQAARKGLDLLDDLEEE